MFEVLSERQYEQLMVFRLAGRNIALTDLTQISTFRMLMRGLIVGPHRDLMLGLAREHDQWFIRSAKGANLNRRLADFGLSRPGPYPASGIVTLTSVGISGVDTTTFQPGVIVRTDPTDGSTPKRYSLDFNPDHPQGWWADVTVGDSIAVTAVAPGPEGNAAAGTITTFDGAQVSCTNVQPIQNGRGPATDDEYVAFFLDYLASLGRSTRPAVQFAILNYQDPITHAFPVFSCSFEEGAGQSLIAGDDRLISVRIYLAGGDGTASGPLVTAITSYLVGSELENSGYIALGIPFEVVSATPLPVAVRVAVDVDVNVNTATAGRSVEQTIRQFLGAMPVAGVTAEGILKGQLNFSRLFRAVMDVPGVLRARFDQPTTDQPVPVGAKVVAGEILVSAQPVGQ